MSSAAQRVEADTHTASKPKSGTPEYYQAHKERFRANRQRSREKNREWVRQQAREAEKRRYHNDPQARIKSRMGSHLCNAFKGYRPSPVLIDALGCPFEEFKAHLERQFVDGMSWQNRGRDGWHVDHIKPLSRFDLTDPVQLSAAFHFTNTQPLWADQNRRKWASDMDGK